MTDDQTFFDKALKHIPGGVNSPVRAFSQVGGTPLFIAGGDGAYLIDNRGQRYIDFIGSWGCLILGHNHPVVRQAVLEAIPNGLGFGAPTVIEVEMALMITQLMPSIEKVRMVNSGTEATLSAIRLARGFTHRDKIIKFEGAYHGHSDSLLVKAGSGVLGLGLPDSPGVPKDLAQHTLVARFNDLGSVEQLFRQHPCTIAGLIVEPVSGNMNCVPPCEGFLQGLRALCDEYQALLIFDEVMTGFRVALGGAQALYGVKPDLTCLGKIVGGGLPVGAFGGRRDIMDQLAPLGPIYQAGTLSGNPITLSAGLANLKMLSEAGIYEQLDEITRDLLQGLSLAAAKYHIPFQTHQVGSMFGFYFSSEATITSFDEVKRSDVKAYTRFFHGMLKQGVYFAPSAFEAGFVSLAHTKTEMDKTHQAAEAVFSTW